jgi:hypothetical protein
MLVANEHFSMSLAIAGSSQAQATRPTAVMLPEAEATHPITL